MRTLEAFQVIKPEIRVLGIDDGNFTPHTTGEAHLVGVVFRGGYSIEGVMHTKIRIDGLDATEKIAAMINDSPHQVRLIMLNGITFAGFNLVDIQKLNQYTKLPVVSLTQNKPNLDDIFSALKNLPNIEERWKIVQNAGDINQIVNKGVKLYMGIAGISLPDAIKIVKLTSTRGSLPEPLRVAHLIASGISF